MIVDELITLLGFDIKDKDKLDKYTNSIKKGVKELQNMATTASVAFAGVITGITHINNEISEMANMRDAMGVELDDVQGMNKIAKDLGMNWENVTDTIEEMNNKLGGSKQMVEAYKAGLEKDFKIEGGLEDFLKSVDLSKVDESFKGLSLQDTVDKIFELDTSKQYDLFIGAAAMAEDAQKAVFAADALMGGEANKLVAGLRKELKRLGISYEEYMIKIKQSNFLNKEGIEGAREYSREFATTSSIFGSVFQQMSGLAGTYITPIIKKINLWMMANKELVQSKLKSWIAGVVNAVERFSGVLKTIWVWIDKGADALGGWSVVLPILGAILAYFYPWKALILGVILAIDDLNSYFEGGKSVIGDFIAYFSANFPLLSAIIEKIGDVFVSIFGLFKSVYDAVVAPVFQLFKSDGESSSSSVLSVFTDAFNAIGVVVKSVLEMLSLSIQALSALFRGDFEKMRAIGEQFTEALTIAFVGMVNFISAGADIIKKAWGASIDWIMSKIKWVTDKIDAVKNTASDIGDDISDSISSAWDGAVNFFGGDDKKSDKIERVKETINNIAPISAPAPSSKSVSNHKTNNISHTHNNNYTIKVNATTSNAHETAETIKSHIVSTKAIEKANINKIKPIHEAK